MAKNDNLTDFLKGLADKFRSVLGTADPLNPQEFEDKIQTVRDEAYSQGFAEGGPTGITATAPDVLSGKVFGSGGSAKATGTMPDNIGSSKAVAWGYNGTNLYMAFAHGHYPAETHWDKANTSEVYVPNADVASVIGLTAAKILRGNTILGIAGTGMPLGAAIWYWSYQTGTANLAPKHKYGVVGSTLPAGTYRFTASWTPYADKYTMILYVGNVAKSKVVSSGGLGLSDTTFTISSAQSYYIKQSDTVIGMYGSAALVKIS